MIRHKILDVFIAEVEIINKIIKDFYPNYNKDKWLN